MTDDVAFPKLTDQELSCVGTIGVTRNFREGAVLIRNGDRYFPFFVVRSGEIVILESSSGEPKEVTVHGPGQFTGDVGMLTRRPAVISAVVRGDSEVYEVD